MSKQDVEIIIDDIHVGYATSAKVSPETSVEKTPTFDGVITDGTDNVSWKVDISKLRYGGIQDYIKLEKILNTMFKTPKTIRIKETAHFQEGDMEVDKYIYNCIIETKDVEYNPTSRTVDTLSFTGNKMRKLINGEEVAYL